MGVSKRCRPSPVKTVLQILLLEDNNSDAELLAYELEKSGFDFQLERIQSEVELRRKMETDKPDLILSDHGLPSFDGFEALAIVRKTDPELPFIFVSGSNNQAMVARMYEEGATDYVFKRDLHDLAPAVREALQPTPFPVLEMPLVKAPPVAAALTQLWLCPSCLRARDEQHVAVDALEYFRSHNEVVVLHELCKACQHRLSGDFHPDS